MTKPICTSEDFKAMKKALGITNKDVADIIGTSEANVKMQTSPGSKMATWACSMVYVYKRMEKNANGNF